MNDLFNIDLNSETFIQAYADDIVILIGEESTYTFQFSSKEILDKIYNWVKTKDLSFNTEKCQHIIITKGESDKRRPPIKINGNKIKNPMNLNILEFISTLN